MKTGQDWPKQVFKVHLNCLMDSTNHKQQFHNYNLRNGNNRRIVSAFNASVVFLQFFGLKTSQREMASTQSLSVLSWTRGFYVYKGW